VRATQHLVWLFLYVVSLALLWRPPLTPIESFAGHRDEYERSFSLPEMEDRFLRVHDPAVAIDLPRLQVRFCLVWFLGVSAFAALHYVQRRRHRSKERELGGLGADP